MHKEKVKNLTIVELELELEFISFDWVLTSDIRFEKGFPSLFQP